MKNNRLRHAGKPDTAAVLALGLAGLCPAAHAGDFAYGLQYSSEYSSNIAHTPTDPQNEWINSVLAGVGYTENTREFAAHVLSTVEYLDYRHDVFSNDTLFNLDSSALWTISPQRFSWSASDVYRQLQTDLLAADTPANRENVNVFSTGPDFLAHISPVQTVVLGARYGNFSTSGGDTDNNSGSGYIRWLYEATPRTTYSLNYETQDVRYADDVANIDYRQQNVFISVHTRPSRSEFILDLGSTKIDRERDTDTRQEMGRLSWVRLINPSSSMGLAYSVQHSSTATDALQTSTPATGPSPLAVPVAQPSAVTSDVYRTKRGEVFYSAQGSRFGTAFGLFGQEVDYLSTLDDYRQHGGDLRFSYNYSETFTTTVFGEYAKTRYTILGRRDTDWDAGLRFARRVGRTVLMTLEGRRIERTSTDPTAPYTDDRILFTVLYSSGPAFRPLSTR